MFTIPDQGEGQNDLQSILFQEYVDVLIAGIAGSECVLSGGAVSAQGAPNMTVIVAKAAVLTNGVLKPVADAAAAVITAADVTNPRLDLVVADATGAVVVRAGAPAAAPQPPARSANDVALAAVYVPAGATQITAPMITDLRILRTKGPIEVGKVSAPVTFNTTNALQTYLSLVVPSGLLLAGKGLHVVCGGNYLSNSGVPTWTLTLSYGGTVLFSDTTAATAADADRGAWQVEFDLVAQANAAQNVVGFAAFQTPAAKNAPVTGVAGDLAVATSVGMPFFGTAAVDSDAADRTLLVQWTMSVSAGTVETVMDYAHATLL